MFASRAFAKFSSKFLLSNCHKGIDKIINIMIITISIFVFVSFFQPYQPPQRPIYYHFFTLCQKMCYKIRHMNSNFLRDFICLLSRYYQKGKWAVLFYNYIYNFVFNYNYFNNFFSLNMFSYIFIC